MNDDNLMIRVLEWATKQTEFSFQELCEHVQLNDTEKKQLVLLINYKSVLFHNHSAFYTSYNHPDVKIFASAEDHFRYLEYVELKEARQSSKDANRKAMVAICISIASMILSAGISIYAIKSEINIPHKAYELFSEEHNKALKELKLVRSNQLELNSIIKSQAICKIEHDPTY
ncbi:hypothetical protein CBQ28_17130 [Pseudoalteromonas sp. GCY]|uniref:hypothetical protein n=1 Tax=Pseudoalteromonas sp. GCY TaxID=2003316 RepID=UPI000BFEC973|nr:hypothetical protein [Pseudoalteromonas sp. GCY]PHI35986.1 hypothetical protein CBQ28_17130 [Pseudoalteromonas sp. GCY]QQQ68534.1 hypothetical protein JJQ94_12375 [Pseudoalteromonas sp. GCY]